MPDQADYPSFLKLQTPSRHSAGLEPHKAEAPCNEQAKSRDWDRLGAITLIALAGMTYLGLAELAGLWS